MARTSFPILKRPDIGSGNGYLLNTLWLCHPAKHRVAELGEKRRLCHQYPIWLPRNPPGNGPRGIDRRVVSAWNVSFVFIMVAQDWCNRSGSLSRQSTTRFIIAEKRSRRDWCHPTSFTDHFLDKPRFRRIRVQWKLVFLRRLSYFRTARGNFHPTS